MTDGRNPRVWFGRACYLTGALALMLFAGQAPQVPPPRSPVPSMAAISQAGLLQPLSPPGEAETDDELIPAHVTIGPGGLDVRLAGDLVEGTARQLAALLDAHPSVTRIHLTSGGGLVDEGNAVGALIATRGLATYVPDYCVSACTLAFMRGRDRFLHVDGRLGFHAPYVTDETGVILPTDAAPERASYLAAGISPDFVTRALQVSARDIWIPEAEDLIRAGMVTQRVDAHRFPDSTLDDDASPQAARIAVLRALPVLSSLDPADLDTVAEGYRAGYLAGRSEGQALAGMKRQAAGFAIRSLRQAGAAAFEGVRDIGRAAVVSGSRPSAGSCPATGIAKPGGCLTGSPRLAWRAD